jgi:uncharacterized protein with NRDE domain
MCLIAFAVNAHPEYPFVMLANRDEFHERPTVPSQWWETPQKTEILSGRDLQGGGTWMGITRTGRLAALTNVRKPPAKPGNKSRGQLVVDALESERPAALALNDYRLFNLLIAQANPQGQWSVMCQNEYSRPQGLNQGIHTLSNASLNSAWPKSIALKLALSHMLSQPLDAWETLAFSALGNTEQHPDDQLPNTGVPLAWERMLSAACIVSPAYGTRSSTLLVADKTGLITWQEQSHDTNGSENLRRVETFQLQWV